MKQSNYHWVIPRNNNMQRAEDGWGKKKNERVGNILGFRWVEFGFG